MSRIAFHRPARILPPTVPESDVSLSPPPQTPDNGGGASGWLMLLLPLLSSVSMAAYMVTYGKTWMVVLGVAFVVLSVGLTFTVRMQTRKNSRKVKERQNKRYFEYLADTRERAYAAAARQRVAAAWLHPGPERLWAVATGRRRVWERCPADEDFLRLRLGTGWGPLAVRLSLGRRTDPTVEYEPKARRAAEELVRLRHTGGPPDRLGRPVASRCAEPPGTHRPHTAGGPCAARPTRCPARSGRGAAGRVRAGPALGVDQMAAAHARAGRSR